MHMNVEEMPLCTCENSTFRQTTGLTALHYGTPLIVNVCIDNNDVCSGYIIEKQLHPTELILLNTAVAVTNLSLLKDARSHSNCLELGNFNHAI